MTSGTNVLAEYSSANTLSAEYIHANGRMLTKFVPGYGFRWFYTDHLGSTRLMGGANNDPTDMRRDYYPYGEAYTTAGNDETTYQFTGKERDTGTGLYYFGVRYYDAGIGRFLTIDPFTMKYLTLTPYHYAANNPLFFMDANGDTINISEEMANSGALLNYLNTKEGIKWLGSFAYKGETITVAGKSFSFNKTGKFSNQNLNFVGNTDNAVGELIPYNSKIGKDYTVSNEGVQSYSVFINKNYSQNFQSDAIFHEVQHAYFYASKGADGRGNWGSTDGSQTLHHRWMLTSQFFEPHRNFLNELGVDSQFIDERIGSLMGQAGIRFKENKESGKCYLPGGLNQFIPDVRRLLIKEINFMNK